MDYYLESEIDYFKSNNIQIKHIKSPNKFQIIEIIVRKCLMLRIVIQDNYPMVWPLSVKLHTFDTRNLKYNRQQVIEEFLKKTNLELNSVIDQNQGKCVIVLMYEKLKNLLSANDEFLNTTLEILETSVKNQEFNIDDGNNKSAAASSNSKKSSTLVSEPDYEDNSKKQKHPKKDKKRNETSEDESKNSKFKGSEFIFQRIKWDDNIDKDQVIIGYLDRFTGIKDIKFNDYKGVHEDLEGVPLHRIRYFKINGKIVWDRDQKIDLITGTGDDISKFFDKKNHEILVEEYDQNEEQKPKSNSKAKKEKLIDGTTYKFISNNWIECLNTSAEPKKTNDFINEFNLLTYNIMSQNNFKRSIISKRNFKKSQLEVLNRAEYEKDELGLKNLDKIDRMHKIIELLETDKPDFISLQECEEYEETKIRENKFIQNNYFICSAKRNDSSQEHSNCIVLSKIKPKLYKILRLTDNSSKSALICKFEIRNDSLRKMEEVLIVNFHLTSNKSNDFLYKRKAQLETLKQYLIDQADEYDFTADYTFFCGDFNFSDSCDDENKLVEDLFLKYGFTDLVKNGFTFDPTTNFSASITAFKQEPRRLDRILFKGLSNKLNLEKSFLVNTAPFKINLDINDPILYEPYLNILSYLDCNKLVITEKGVSYGDSKFKSDSEFYLHPSDHYGLECYFKFKNSLHESNIVHKSTLAFIAPSCDSEEFIQSVRKDYDPQINRWPPHINLLYPFYQNIDLDLNQDQEASVIGDLLACLSKFKPFQCDLCEIGVFEKNNVIYLEPSKDAQNKMSSIYKELKILFEDEKNSKWTRPTLTPHMTIAQPVDKRKAEKNWAKNILEEIKNKYKDLIKNRKPLASFTVDCIYWMTRTDETPFKIKYAFPLGSRYPLTVTGLNPNDLTKNGGLLKFLNDNSAILTNDFDNKFNETYEKIRTEILKSLKLTSGSNNNENSLIPIGSYQHGIKCNDLDLCIVKLNDFEGYNQNRTEFSSSLAYNLSQNTNLFHIIRNIDDAIVPIIELCLKLNNENYCQGADIQIQEIKNDVDLKYENLNTIYFDNFKFMLNIGKKIDEHSILHPISGIFENQNLKKYVRYYKDYQVVLSFVKYWAKSRNIYGKAFGFLGGISWSIMVIYFLQQKFDFFIHELSLDNSELRFQKILNEFFKFYSNYDWSQAISLINLDHINEYTKKFQHKTSIMILQSVYPYNNTSKNVSDKTKKLIITELKRCLKILSESNNYELACEKIKQDDLPTNKIKFKIIYNNPNDISHLMTVFKAKIQGLITSLQRINQKIEFKPLTEFFETENLEKVRLFYILINDPGYGFNEREKQMIIDYSNTFIDSIKAISHSYDYNIQLEFN